MTGRTARAVAGVLVVAAVAAGLATVLVSLWWLPSAPGIDRDLLTDGPRAALAARDLQTWALAAVAVTGTAAAVLAATTRRWGVAVLATATVAAAAGTVVLRRTVLWDQLALWAVTDLGEPRGLWFAARHDAVRSVLVGDEKVEQGPYGVAVVLHTVVAPLVMLATAGAAARLSRRHAPVARDDASGG